MTHYPIIFGFRDRIVGNGFLAGVAVNGRALLVETDEGESWVHGVYPGGMTGVGDDIGEAQKSFRETFTTVLFDIAADAPTFDAFEAEVRRFFFEANETVAKEWSEAVVEVRAGQVKADWLPLGNADAPPTIHLVSLKAQDLVPSVNEPDEEPALAAASGF